MKQIIFRDLETHENYGGILTDERNVICGCCGGLLEAKEENQTWKIIKIYNNWMNLENAICGDDIDNITMMEEF